MNGSQRTKSALLFSLGALLSAVVSLTILSSGPEPEVHELFTCPMHPKVIKEHAGDCPICGMSLVSKSSPAPHTHNTKHVVVPAHIIQSIGVRTSSVVKGPLSRTLRSFAQVQIDERRVTAVTTKFEGWIEKLHVHETGQFVRKGQSMFSIYSPRVVSSQQEYLLAKRQNNELLLDSARSRLLNWELSPAQIRKLEARGKPIKATTLHAPNSGYVFSKSIVQGAKVKPDQTLLRLVDLSSVWVQAEVYSRDLPWLKLGQAAELTVSYLPGRTFHGEVSFIAPRVDESTRAIKVRIELPNPENVLKPGMFGTVHIKAVTKPQTSLIPSSAILRSGRRNIVFLALPDGRYQPVAPRLGAFVDEHWTEVLDGLQPGQRIVTSAQFLLDSQSQLQEALEKFIPHGAASRPMEHP